MSPDPFPIVVCKILSMKFCFSDSCTCITPLVLATGDSMVAGVSESDCTGAAGALSVLVVVEAALFAEASDSDDPNMSDYVIP